MARLTFLAVLVGAMGLVQWLPDSDSFFAPARLSLNYGFLLLAAYLVGGFFSRCGLPRISGYILAGVLAGPYLLGFIDAGLAVKMKLIDDLALSFIALTAGAELRLGVLKARWRPIGFLVLATGPVLMVGVAVISFGLRGWVPFLAGLSPLHAAVVVALVGVIAAARSPTSAIAIIDECKARGSFTDTVFGVIVATDFVVLLLFALVAALGVAVVSAGQGVDVLFVGEVMVQLLVSVGLGVGLGGGVAYYIQRVDKNLSVVLVVLAFLVTESSRWVAHIMAVQFDLSFHLEPLLIATAAGFTVTNFTRAGKRLTEGLHAISLPVFVVFFAMAGVSLHLGALQQTWLVAVVFVGLRMVVMSSTAYLGCTLANETPRFRRLCGFGFYTQAGVSLGLAQEVMRRFPEWETLGTLLVACITVNEVVGPVAFKFALDRMGDSGREG